MNTNKKPTITFSDVKISVKIKLSALWVTLMLFYIYADILGFYTPGNIENVVSGEIGGVQITNAFLFVMAIWMEVVCVARAEAGSDNMIVRIMTIPAIIADLFEYRFMTHSFFQPRSIQMTAINGKSRM